MAKLLPLPTLPTLPTLWAPRPPRPPLLRLLLRLLLPPLLSLLLPVLQLALLPVLLPALLPALLAAQEPAHANRLAAWLRDYRSGDADYDALILHDVIGGGKQGDAGPDRHENLAACGSRVLAAEWVIGVLEVGDEPAPYAAQENRAGEYAWRGDGPADPCQRAPRAVAPGPEFTGGREFAAG